MTDTRLALIQSYVDRGWAPVPIPPRSKNPGFDGWQHFAVAAGDLATMFGGNKNVGLILGDRSGGLTDIDLDCVETMTLAPTFLPATTLKHGRKHKPRSHWWYVCDPGTDVHQFRDIDGVMLVECRGNGGQTIVPPSVNKNDDADGTTILDALAWEQEGEPSSVDGRILLAQVERLAACALLARHWPAQGSRHETALAVSGALLRHGWHVEQVTEFVTSAARVAGDPEIRDRERAVRDTADNLAANRPCTGLPRLAEIVGDRAVQRFTQWLGLQSETSGRLLLETQLRAAIEERKPWKEILDEVTIPDADDLPYWFGRLVTHVKPYTTMFPDDWAFMLVLPFWASLWPHVRLQNLNLVIWTLGVNAQGTGKNVASKELLNIARGISSVMGSQLMLFTSGTPEGIWDSLGGVGRQMLCYHAEYAGFLKLLKRDHMQHARETLCALYDGDPVGHRRSQGKAAEIESPHVVVVATVNQPDLVLHARREDLQNGYLSRFLVCAPNQTNTLPEYWPFEHDPLRRQLVDGLALHATRLREVQVIEWEESGQHDPPLLDQYRTHLGVGTGELIDLDTIRDTPVLPAGRLLARVKKIAALLELAERDPQVTSNGRKALIRPAHLGTAIDIVERGRAYAERMAAWIGESADVELGDRILRKLKSEAGGLSQRDLCRHLKTPSRDVQTALDLLESEGRMHAIRAGRVTRWFSGSPPSSAQAAHNGKALTHA